MPETPDFGPRHRWALECAYGAVHRGRSPRLCDPSSLTASSVGSISMQTGLSIGGVHHAEEEQEGAGAASALQGPAFLRWALLMRAIK